MAYFPLTRTAFKHRLTVFAVSSLLPLLVGAQVLEGTSPPHPVHIGHKVKTQPQATNPPVPFPVSDVDRNIPVSSIAPHDGVAVVIGIQRYQNPDIPPVDFAVNDALAMKEYLIRELGYKPENILLILNEKATQAAFKRIFEAQLANYLPPDSSGEVFVYYSGHGAPDPETQRAFFVPYDCDPSYAKQTGYSLDEFYRNLNKLPAKRTLVVLDACFSGASEKGSLLKDVSPIFISVEAPEGLVKSGAVFTSATGLQISSWYPEEHHGLFTYFFLKGLRGAADSNQDRQISVDELYDFLKERVSYQAQRLRNRVQQPGLETTDPSLVLVKF